MQSGAFAVYKKNDDWEIYPRLETTHITKSLHTSCINNILSLNEYEVLTTSLDDSLKIFDLNRQKANFEIYFKNSSISSVDYHNSRKQVYVAHVKGIIRMFDERVRNKVAVQSLKGHNCYVSQVKVDQSHDYRVVSGDYKGLVKVWDIRMQKNLYDIDCHSGQKIFSI